MNGMTTQERIDDICKRSGLSEEIVRRVQRAETDSIVESLKRGERTTLIGRVTLKPYISTKLEIGGTVKKLIKVRFNTSSSLEAELEKCPEFEVDTEEEDTGIRLNQIPSLV